MNQEQLKTLAETVMLNDERLYLISDVLVGLIEAGVRRGLFSENELTLLSAAEQLSALSRDANAARQNTRKALGLS